MARSLVEERLALLVLLRRRSSGWADVVRGVAERGSAYSVAEQLGELNPGLFDESDPWSEDLEAAAVAMETWEAEGWTLLTVLDPEYPSRLRDVRQPPPFVILRGTRDERDAGGVCVVGSRRASTIALREAARFSSGLAEAGVVVLSGLAAGVDTAAHNAALAAGGRTVGVIGTGVTRSYPAENAALQERIAREHLLVSRFWPDSPPSKFSFPLRNEVMSAWGAATCVIQADMKSGARMQARVALQQGRRLFLHRLLEGEDWARAYAADGSAAFVAEPADVIEALR